MGEYQHHFAIVHSPGSQDAPVRLHTALPADAASVAFADELLRLQRAGAPGDLLVYCLNTNRVMLRQPLASVNEVVAGQFIAREPLPSALRGTLLGI